MSRDWTFKEGGEYSDLGGDSYFGVVGTGGAGDTQSVEKDIGKDSK